MAFWSIIKEAIASVIKTNGNQEITGQLLQSVLTNIVSSVGKNATFAGVATPSTSPGIPDGPVFYLAYKYGVYSNFNGITIDEGDDIKIIKNEEIGTWVSINTGIACNSVLAKIIDELEKLKSALNTENESDVCYITDLAGNVIVKIDHSGISTTDVNIKKGNDFISVLQKISDDYQKFNEDEIESLQAISQCISPVNESAFYITDKNGNVVFSIDNGGVSLKYKDGKSWMNGLTLMSLCDSLGTSGIWQERIAELTGMVFDKALNYNGDNDTAFSVGGSQTATHPNGGFDRAMRLVDYVKNKNGKADVVLLENINDMTWVNVNETLESIDQKIETEIPFFCEQYKYIDTGANSYSGAKLYFNDNIGSILNSISVKRGTTLYLGYSIESKKLTFLSGANSEGSIILTVGGSQYYISIISGMTISDIIDKILEISFSDPSYKTTKDGNDSVIFTSQTNSPSELSIDVNTTGIISSISDINSTSYVQMSYNSLSLTYEEWVKTSNWGELWGHNLIQIMKGFLEYLCTNLPNTQFYWFIPTRFTGAIPTTLREDGTIDYDSFRKEDKKYELCVYIQKKVCEYYNIPVLNLYKESGINVLNQLSYYAKDGGVHPPHDTYVYWANKIINKLI